MNVCVLGLRGVPRIMGGVETHCEQLFPLLKRARPRDTFTVIARKRYVAERRFEYLGLTVVSLAHASDKRLETITNAICGVFYAGFVLRADLLHLQGIGAAVAVPLAKLFGMTVITTYHSKNYEHSKWNAVARFVLRAGELFAVAIGDRIIVVSRSLERDLKQRFPGAAHKVFFIPNGADHLDDAPDCSSDEELLREHGLTGRRYVVAVGRLVPEKGLHDLIEAFEAVDLAGCQLVIVGDADHDDAYARRLRSCAGDRIVFTGFLPREKVYGLLRNASLFVLPSYNEGMPIAALEAITAGAPILLSDIEPNRDLGLEPRNYFAVGNVDDLRRKIREDHASYAVDRCAILRRYSWGSACAQTSELYASIEEHLSAKRGRTVLQPASLSSAGARNNQADQGA